MFVLYSSYGGANTDPELQVLNDFAVFVNFLSTPVGTSGGMQDATALNIKVKKNEESVILELEKTSSIEQDSVILSSTEELLPEKSSILEPDANISSPNFKPDESKWKCFEFCYLFPKNYEFDKDDIVQLWISQGFISVPPVEMNIQRKDIAINYFDAFLFESLIQLSTHNCSTSRPRYKLNHSILDFLQEAPNDDYSRSRLEGGKPINMSENTRHASLLCNHNDRLNLESLYSFKRLQTLLLLNEHASCVERIPHELFLQLNLLRALDCSYTKITELPSSVIYLKDLRYLNLSGTAIKMLPESLCSLFKLQTLLLRDCTELVGLPKGMQKLLNLEHLDIDLACLLMSMPPGFARLTKLQVLPAFVISKEEGCHIDELKSMVHLQGSLCILRLENVSNSKEAQEAALNEKKNLHELELQWSESSHDGEEVLRELQPHAGLKVLQVVGYSGATFPCWIADPIFSKLVDITFYNCRRIELLPPLGKLPSLKSIRMGEMHAVQTIDTRFCGRHMITGLSGVVLNTICRPFIFSDVFTAFPMLEKLKLNGMLNLEKWSGMQVGDFPMLQKLTVSRFPKLIALPELSVLNSLQQLNISFCPALQFFPKNGLPTSLQSLLIVHCPLLKERCRKSEGEEWEKIAHIPDIVIDHQQII
ncbi:hypothetical protein ACHQM5_010918 [Ranunculus cassubicifolius]